MFMYILYEGNASTWSHNQFILLVMYKWTEDEVWMEYTLCKYFVEFDSRQKRRHPKCSCCE